MDHRMILTDAALPGGGTYVGPNPNCPNLWPVGTNVEPGPNCRNQPQGGTHVDPGQNFPNWLPGKHGYVGIEVFEVTEFNSEVM